MKKNIFVPLALLFILLGAFKSRPSKQVHLKKNSPMQSAVLMDSSSFDFWIGKWNATWDENGTTCHATNNITRVMNNKFIHESFEILDGANKGFKGESFSILDNLDGKWKQTWVDTDGSYLDFIGSQEGDTKIFERTYTNTKGKEIKQRMRFYNIKHESFSWDWESSTEEGKWVLGWRIFYTRTI